MTPVRPAPTVKDSLRALRLGSHNAQRSHPPRADAPHSGALRSGIRPSHIALAALATAAAVALGYILRPDLIAPIERDGVVGTVGWPLETAFTLWAIASSTISFRAADVLFRKGATGPVDLLPVHPAAVVIHRLGRLTAESVALAFLVLLVLLPAAGQPGGGATTYAAAWLLAGALVTPCLAFAVPVLVTWYATRPDSPQLATMQRAGSFALRGVFHGSAPIALGTTLVALLLLKLGVDEWARGVGLDEPIAMTRAARFALGAALLPVLLAVTAAARLYASHHVYLTAHFRAAEDTPVPLGYEWLRLDPRWATWPVADRITARERARWQRRFPFLLAGTITVALLCAVVAASVVGTGGRVAAITVAGLWLLAFVAPGRRLRQLYPPACAAMDALLIDADTLHRAHRRVLRGVVLRHGAPVLAASTLPLLVHADPWPLLAGVALVLACAVPAELPVRRR